MHLASIMKSEAPHRCIQVVEIVARNQSQAHQQVHAMDVMNPLRLLVLQERCSSLSLTVPLDRLPKIRITGG